MSQDDTNNLTGPAEPPQAASFETLPGGAAVDDSESGNRMELLFDLQLPVSIELGRTNLFIREILGLERGSIVEFDKLASEPVDVLVNGKKVAEGEVVVVDKHFGIRITSLADSAERLRTVRR